MFDLATIQANERRLAAEAARIAAVALASPLEPKAVGWGSAADIAQRSIAISLKRIADVLTTPGA